MGKYLASFKIALKKSLQYRARLLIWFFWDIAPPLIMMFFWTTAYKSRQQIGGYDYSEMIIYLLVIIFARNLVLTHPDFILQSEIAQGKINKYFLQPAKLIYLKFIYSLAYRYIKLIYLAPFLLILNFFFLRTYSIKINFEMINIILFLFVCAFSFCLFFLMRFLIGILSFWFTEIEWLISLEELIFWLFGGVLLPLEFFPFWMQRIADFLPFKYILYLPAQILLGKLNLNQMFFCLLIQFFWLMVFYFLVKKTYRAGIKIYSGFGG